MRKIIDIPDELLQDLKILAVLKGQSFKRFIEQSLVELVKQSKNSENGNKTNNNLHL